MFLSPLGERLGEGVTEDGLLHNPLTQPLPQGGEEYERSLWGGSVYRAMNSAATTRKAISAFCWTAPRVSPV
jgi:hypothetical protein